MIEQYEFISDIWELIKSYSGIYNITDKWGLIIKVNINVLNYIYKKNYNRQITNSSLDHNYSKKIIIKRIFNSSPSYYIMKQLSISIFNLSILDPLSNLRISFNDFDLIYLEEYYIKKRLEIGDIVYYYNDDGNIVDDKIKCCSDSIYELTKNSGLFRGNQLLTIDDIEFDKRIVYELDIVEMNELNSYSMF
jgi:hypothetical protein